MFITMGDSARLHFLFNRRIAELEKMLTENPDLEEELNMKIMDYRETLSKYDQFNGDEK